MDAPGWTVQIAERGRSGTIAYREGEDTLVLSWEFGGTAEVVAILALAADRWDARHRWAAGRRTEILSRVGEEVVRQKAPTCVVDLGDADRGWVYIRPSPTVR
jgi:hypothetical protein